MFGAKLPLFTSCLISALLIDDIADTENLGVIFYIFRCFSCRGTLRLSLHPSISSLNIKDLYKIIDGALSDFQYWLNSNNLVVIWKALQHYKNLYFHIIFYVIYIYLLFKIMKTVQTTNINLTLLFFLVPSFSVWSH